MPRERANVLFVNPGSAKRHGCSTISVLRSSLFSGLPIVWVGRAPPVC